MQNDIGSKVTGELKRIGYAHVTLDLEGYRRGSLNQNIVVPKRDTAPQHAH
jgi:PP-loop superfamily ATP-utilizing enzyme